VHSTYTGVGYVMYCMLAYSTQKHDQFKNLQVKLTRNCF